MQADGNKNRQSFFLANQLWRRKRKRILSLSHCLFHSQLSVKRLSASLITVGKSVHQILGRSSKITPPSSELLVSICQLAIRTLVTVSRIHCVGSYCNSYRLLYKLIENCGRLQVRFSRLYSSSKKENTLNSISSTIAAYRLNGNFPGRILVMLFVFKNCHVTLPMKSLTL